MKKCPCEECICRPACRNKGYYELVRGCDILWRYINTIPHYSIYRGKRANKYLEEAYNVLETDKWYIEKGEFPDEGNKKSFWRVFTSKK